MESVLSGPVTSKSSPSIRLDEPHLPTTQSRMKYYHMEDARQIFESLQVAAGKVAAELGRESKDFGAILKSLEGLRHDYPSHKTAEWDESVEGMKTAYHVLMVKRPKGWEPECLQDTPPGLTDDDVDFSWGEMGSHYMAQCVVVGWNLLYERETIGRRRHDKWAIMVPVDSPIIPKPKDETKEDDDGGPRHFYAAHVKWPKGWEPTAATDNPPELRNVLFFAEEMLYEDEDNTLAAATEQAIRYNTETLAEVAKDRRKGRNWTNPEDFYSWHVVIRIPESDADDGAFTFLPGESNGVLNIHRRHPAEWIKFEPAAVTTPAENISGE